MQKHTVHVRLGARSHPIVIGKSLLPKALTSSSTFSGLKTRVFVIADSHLRPIAQRIIRSFGTKCAGSFFLSGGEATKDMSTLPKLYAAACQARLDRKSFIVAIGGGVIGDVTGFFAATYLRGIRIVHVPTTLVAQVDSAIGGKTGVNLPKGKNLVGAFHQPALVMVDSTTLKTLPDRQFRSGLAEVIKYGIIDDSILFRRLESRTKQILNRDPKELSWIIQRCCEIKARVVSQDEFETKGLRAILNFGHTIGHGIENAAQYKLLHGEAIALGMVGATYLSQKLGDLTSIAAQRINNLIGSFGLPVRLKIKLPTSKIVAAMRLDKKAGDGQIRFVLADDIGNVRTGIPVSEVFISEALATLC
jgi:3-dehydroquinate synthase